MKFVAAEQSKTKRMGAKKQVIPEVSVERKYQANEPYGRFITPLCEDIDYIRRSGIFLQ
jgi:hypothetical protein